MQTIEGYFVAASLIYIWTEIVFEQVFKTKDYLGRVTYRLKMFKLIDRKPFNCGTCISFWSGIIMCLITFNLIFLSLPIMYKLINKYL